MLRIHVVIIDDRLNITRMEEQDCGRRKGRGGGGACRRCKGWAGELDKENIGQRVGRGSWGLPAR
jgi:hypothetical protein